MRDTATKEEVNSIVELIGGRFSDLLSASTLLKDAGNQTLEKKLAMILGMAKSVVRDQIDLLPENVLAVVYEIARSMINSSTGMITAEEYSSLVKKLNKSEKNLIGDVNVFFMRPDEVEFHSRLTKQFFKDLYAGQ